jgi:hypothetical protein
MALNLRGSEKDVSGKTFSLHPSEYASKTARIKNNGKKERVEYQKPWRQAALAPISKTPEMIVDPNGINKNFRQLLPGNDFNDLLEYFFPKEMNSHSAYAPTPAIEREPQPIATNSNLYTKLFNSQFEIDRVSSQIKVSKPELSRRFAEFLTDTSKRLQDATKTIQSLPHFVTAEKMFDEIRESVIKGTGAKHLTIYLLYVFSSNVVERKLHKIWLSNLATGFL